MVDYVPSEKAMPIRQPSTANLFISSTDRTTGYGNNFTISKNQSILNGFFTRLGVSEVVLSWAVPNITEINKTVTVTVDGSGSQTITLPAPTFATIADCLISIVKLLNVAYGNPALFSVQQVSSAPHCGDVAIVCAQEFFFTVTNLITQLGLPFGAGTQAFGQVVGSTSVPNIQRWLWADFISYDLTYNQSLKDGTTNTYVKDVICRWYLAWDNPPSLDGYGFPILMGYQPFVARRLFNFPKQIRWEPNMPIGNLSFEVLLQPASVGGAAPQPPIQPQENDEDAMEWQMTLQVSEV